MKFTNFIKQILFTHERNISVVVTDTRIIYKIPIYSEQALIAGFSFARKNDTHIVIEYDVNQKELEAMKHHKEPVPPLEG